MRGCRGCQLIFVAGKSRSGYKDLRADIGGYRGIPLIMLKEQNLRPCLMEK